MMTARTLNLPLEIDRSWLYGSKNPNLNTDLYTKIPGEMFAVLDSFIVRMHFANWLKVISGPLID
ncbi:hypothetical protein, partial [Klebsiella aerogenes]|uniref:hypothetical protein n=1 Tax=Klebsiella aerogenes TaxID=548 RepID=UPI001967A276